MKSYLRNAPIRTKLRFIILATCCVSLLVACVTLFAVQFHFFRKNFITDMVSTSRMLAAQSIGALDFESESGANQILQTLLQKSAFTGAKLFVRNEDGANDNTALRELSAFGVIGSEIAPYLATKVEQQWWDGDSLMMACPIHFDGVHKGTLFVRCDYGKQSSHLLNLFFAISCMVLAISVLVAWGISVRLAQVISTPIQKLAETAHAIASQDKYHFRAEKMANDEVGAFTETFNFMLDQVEFRDTALRHEIAERERAEKLLQQTQTQLLEASHQAGMAEVATGVLHNVGNVLNSVNVSASVISEKLNDNRLEKLQRTAAMLIEKNGTLGDFISSDPKGKLIPGYLSNLGAHLITERKEALSELESLSRNIEHIKEIVAMQQSHARVFGMVERIRPEILVDDAIRMVAMSLRRHQVELVREVENSNLVDVDRHKVLQILVNLLRNAKHAMENSESDLRRVTVSVVGDKAGGVAISVTDTGCGIPAENLTKIFSHGFTTRKDGHGFGLHSSALAAQQMGGRLIVKSGGVGHGASFILELPPVNQDIATV
jgi:two-component system, NtrC family, sensor kinase